MLFKDFGLDTRLMRSFEHFGYDVPTEIQERAIPEVVAGRDLLASSKTGSGKTFAYLLPAINRVYQRRALSRRDPRVIILVPTRELAKQVYGQLRTLLAGSRLTSALILGGENFNDQHKALQKDPHFVVGTPGRLTDHLEKRHLYLEGTELLILDEADRMLDLGFADSMRAINKAASHRQRQTIFFSATLDNTDVSNIAEELLREPSRVAVGHGSDQHQDIAQHVLLSDHLDHKEALLKHLLTHADLKQGIVFTATKQDTVRLSEMVSSWGFTSEALSGDLGQSARNQVMENFSRGKFQVLVSTDIASRGLDIAAVSHVINFDVPNPAEEFVHRTGRTGRAGFKGDAYTFVGPKDWYNFKAVEEFLKTQFATEQIEGLEPSFKGIKAKKAGVKTTDRKGQKAKSKKADHRNTKRKSSKAVVHDNRQDGFEPFKLPKKKLNVSDNNDS
ncbi:DEAD/DEAH box helicase [Marinomonas balearica]|uniref:Superfamily II DNA/RNA helicase n=1 Tax=Marinomonas balearica TaxID=491947 RepID=A0A4R6MBL3_9GAMM|nr:DEAD/DEAH box helicase [Marinomonas balearica]TDO98893.1 superfamily II DNA/RNA helicase [Marinomonas balearica]